MSATAAGGMTENHPTYRLQSGIAQFCLPAANRDLERKFAYANSIAFTFLILGLVGAVAVPKIVERQLPVLEDIVPVVFTPPESEPPPPSDEAVTEPEPETAQISEAPVVATVVAANAAEASFPVPVEGPVIFAPAKYAGPPPAVLNPPPRPAPRPPPGPTRFNWAGSTEGSFPKPLYTTGALPSGTHELVLLVWVDAEGRAERVEVEKSCGSLEQDRKTVQHVRTRWRWKPGEPRFLSVPFEFVVR
ncbi:MAG: energy transducer TonB [Verrucomicrobia bacterium]|jgi:protein TonB|nr:energy transducer TonB [Verrucomicrobiota bacterium]